MAQSNITLRLLFLHLSQAPLALTVLVSALSVAENWRLFLGSTRFMQESQTHSRYPGTSESSSGRADVEARLDDTVDSRGGDACVDELLREQAKPESSKLVYDRQL